MRADLEAGVRVASHFLMPTAHDTALQPGELLKFVKLDEVNEAEHVAYGIATAEDVDSEGEIADYKFHKAEYRRWSKEALDSTTAAGQDPSLGNVRIMHGLEIGGKVVKIEFDDEAQQIRVGSAPKDDDIWAQLKGGFFRGYSQGGRYVWRRCADCDHELPLQAGANFCPNCKRRVHVRYASRLSEISFVDNPSLGVAVFESVKFDGFRYIASDGRVEKRSFADRSTDVSKQTIRLPLNTDEARIVKDAKGRVRSEIAKFTNLAGDAKTAAKAKIELAAKRLGLDLVAEEKKLATIKAWLDARATAFLQTAAADDNALVKARAAGILAKGMYEVARFAAVMQDLQYLYYALMTERDWEGDESELCDELGENIVAMLQTFLGYAEEEAQEMSAAVSHLEGGTLENADKLLKAARHSLATHFKKAAAHHEGMVAHHETAAESHKDAAEKEGVYKAHHKTMHKVHMAKAKMHKAHASHLSKMADHCAEEDSEKADKLLKLIDAATSEFEVVKAEAADTTVAAAATETVAKTETEKLDIGAAAGDVLSKAVKGAIEDIQKDPDFQKTIRDAVLETMKTSMRDQLKPSGAAVAGAQLIDRSGTQVNKTSMPPAAPEAVMADTGL